MGVFEKGVGYNVDVLARAAGSRDHDELSFSGLLAD